RARRSANHERRRPLLRPAAPGGRPRRRARPSGRSLLGGRSGEASGAGQRAPPRRAARWRGRSAGVAAGLRRRRTVRQTAQPERRRRGDADDADRGGRVMAGRQLSDEERAIYAWQLGVPGFGEEGQQRLKDASVLVSRVGGVGGMVAHQLAAAGVGKLVLAHAGALRADDLNRQLLMRHDGIGKPRTDLAAQRLRELNPFVEIETHAENVSEANVERLVSSVDAGASCAPLFGERLVMNKAAVRLGKPLVDCAMYELQMQVLTVLPGHSACLACLYPEEPAEWQRRFPVFGAVA